MKIQTPKCETSSRNVFLLNKLMNKRNCLSKAILISIGFNAQKEYSRFQFSQFSV